MTNPSSPKSAVLHGKTAAVLGAVFLGLFALFTLLGTIDRIHRPRLETIPAASK